MNSMTLSAKIERIIRTRPGVLGEEIREEYGLTSYRFNRALRVVGRELTEETVVHSEEHGVWIVRVVPGRCQGVEWKGAQNGGYHQCDRAGAFDDGCCFDHSVSENPDMVHFVRKIGYLSGPGEPDAFVLSRLNQVILEGLMAALTAIEPWTAKDTGNKTRLFAMLSHAAALIRWKERMRRLHREEGIPPELRDRHRTASMTPYAFTLRKHFAILEVPSDAAKEEIVAAWKRLAKKYHPDVEHGDGDKMKAINLAKERIFALKRWD
ncbi:MAG: DnaJ domain-containing protein [Pseudomonadota bacterium]